MPRFEDNNSPYLTFVETAVPSNPPSGKRKIYVDPADHKLKMVDDTGGITVMDAGSVTTLASTLAVTGKISPAQITANQNDYNPTSLSTATIIRLSSDASRDITGLAGGADGRVIILMNVGAQDIVLKDDDALSTAANRFALTGNVTMTPDMSILLVYDSTSSRWRTVGSGASGGGSSSAWTQVINESGVSFANWTGASGTWSSDGTVIKQTETTASQHKRARYTAKVPTDLMVFQADIQLKTTNGSAGFLSGFDGTNNSGWAVRLEEAANVIQVERDGVTLLLSFANAIAIDTWYTVKFIQSGHRITLYLDGVLMGSIDSGSVDFVRNVSYVGLLTYQCAAWYRNIKAWNLVLPS